MLTARRIVPLVVFAAIAAAIAGAWVSHGEDVTALRIPGASTDRGRHDLATLGCGTCHTIPGVHGADAGVGPPLIRWSERAYIAGRIPNTPANLVRWITSPQAVEPGTAMPDMGITKPTARDMAAYLYTLGDRERYKR